MKQLIFTMAAALAMAEPLADAPVIAWNKQDIGQMRNMGLPGIPPFARDGVVVFVQAKKADTQAVNICVTFDEAETACSLAKVGEENRLATATIHDGFRDIKTARVSKITVEEFAMTSLGTSEVAQ